MSNKDLNKGVMKLIDASTGLMECRSCGASHTANIMPQSGGRYYPGSWKCVHGCTMDDVRLAERAEAEKA